MVFEREVEEDELQVRREAVESIKTLWGVKQGRIAFEREEKQARVILDNWFRTHPDEARIDDLEHNLYAELRPGGFTTVYEAPAAIKERDPSLYRRLEELGCFTLDDALVKNAVAKGWLAAGDIEHYQHEIARSPSLRVERLKE